MVAPPGGLVAALAAVRTLLLAILIGVPAAALPSSALAALLVDSSDVTILPLAGGSVVLTGQDLDTATDLQIDGQSVPFTSTLTTLSFTAPAHAAGDVTVSVSSATESASLAGGLTYATATFTGLSPGSGALAGGTSVTITGTNLQLATAVSFDGVDGAIVGTTTSTSLTVTTPQGAQARAVDVTVTTPDGPLTQAGAFTYLPAPPPPAPTIIDVSPFVGPPAGGTTVTIRGSNLDAVTFVTFDGIPATIIGTPSASVLAVMSPPSATRGMVDVVLTSAGGTATDNFYYSDPARVDPPGVTTLPFAGGEVVITGDNLDVVDTVQIGGGNASITAGSNTELRITAGRNVAGTYDITLSTFYGTITLPGAVRYAHLPPAPSAISPPSGPIAGGTQVTITGQNFENVSSVVFGGVTFTGFLPTETDITLVTPPHAQAGPVDVEVISPEGRATLTGAFTYLAPGTITRADVTALPLAGGEVNLFGTGIEQATRLTLDGQDVVSAVVATGQLRFTAPPHAAGPVSLVIETPGGTSTFTGLTYALPPGNLALTPATASTRGGTAIRLTGSDLATVTRITVDGIAASFRADGADIVFTAPPHAAQSAVPVLLTGPGGEVVAVPGGLTYVAPPAEQSVPTPAVSDAVRGFFRPTFSPAEALRSEVAGFLHMRGPLPVTSALGFAYADVLQGFISPSGGKVATSLSAIDAAMGRRQPRDWDVFMDATFTALAAGQSSGTASTAHLGLTSRVSPETVAGAVLTLDWQALSSASGKTAANTAMISPFIGGRLSETLFYDAYAGFGLVHMQVTSDGVTDPVHGTRMGFGGSLSGRYTSGDVTVSPAVTFDYAEVSLDPYMSAGGTSFTAYTAGRGDLAFAPTISYRLTAGGVQLIPSLGLALGVGIEKEDGALHYAGISDAVSLGLGVVTANAATLEATVRADGWLAGRTRSLSARVGLAAQLH